MPSNHRSPFSKRMHGSAQEWFMYRVIPSMLVFVYGSPPIPTHVPFPTLSLQGMLRPKCLLRFGKRIIKKVVHSIFPNQCWLGHGHRPRYPGQYPRSEGSETRTWKWTYVAVGESWVDGGFERELEMSLGSISLFKEFESINGKKCEGVLII